MFIVRLKCSALVASVFTWGASRCVQLGASFLSMVVVVVWGFVRHAACLNHLGDLLYTLSSSISLLQQGVSCHMPACQCALYTLCSL
jgi:hypothetical protein